MTDPKSLSERLRECRECGETKPLASFPLWKGRWYSHHCHACYSRRVHRRYVAKGRPAHVKQSARKNAAQRHHRHPEQAKARRAIRSAIDAGRLIRPDTCEQCGSAPPQKKNGAASIEAHHYLGYERPLDIRWLCHACHHQAHYSTSNGWVDHHAV